MSSKFNLIYVILATILLSTVIAQQATKKEVKNEEIRDSVLSLYHSYQVLEDKLDRHEYRERALGEMLKKGLSTLQRNNKVFEPIVGSFSRLEERVGVIESLLLTQEEKTDTQNSKIKDAVEALMKLMSEPQRPSDILPDRKESSEEDDSLSKKIGDLADTIKELRNEIGELRAEKDNSETSNKMMVEQVKKLVDSKLASADEVIFKLEEKLSNFYITGPATTPAPHASEWEKEISNSLGEIKSSLSEQKSGTSLAVGTPSNLESPDRTFVQGLFNETLEAIEEMRLEVLTASDKSFARTAARIKESNQALENSITEALNEQTMAFESYNSDIQKNYGQIQTELQSLEKIEKIILDSSNNILDTKKKVEYGIHQIQLETADVVRAGSKELNGTIHKRFDEIDATILDNHHGSLTNLSSKIEIEISKVWRQIGIMYNEISASKQALDKLQQLSEFYVNGTLSTMDGMEDKVSLITTRMSEVDGNLNYLLGKLGLVTQEFNAIKHGLGDALDNIRSSFAVVQSKIKDVGPGPHQIPSSDNENETDFNLGPAPPSLN